MCGNCKHGAYFDNIVGKCKPCSPCCKDGKDILERGCQVPGVVANKQCNFARSEKCAKVALKNVSISLSLTQHPTPSTTVISRPTTMYPTTKKVDKASVLSASSAPSSHFIGIVAGVPTSVVALAVILALICSCKKRRNHKTKTGLHTVENERHKVGLEQDLLIVATPEQESPYQSPMSPVEETCKNPLPIQDSQPPACSDSKVNFNLVIK